MGCVVTGLADELRGRMDAVVGLADLDVGSASTVEDGEIDCLHGNLSEALKIDLSLGLKPFRFFFSFLAGTFGGGDAGLLCGLLCPLLGSYGATRFDKLAFGVLSKLDGRCPVLIDLDGQKVLHGGLLGGRDLPDYGRSRRCWGSALGLGSLGLADVLDHVRLHEVSLAGVVDRRGRRLGRGARVRLRGADAREAGGHRR